MSGIITNNEYYYSIASAIRNKLGVDTLYKPIQMAKAISTIPSFKPAVSVATLSVFDNGLYSASSGYAYSRIEVNVNPDISFSSLYVNANGSYTAPEGYGYGEVTVDVHESEDYDKVSLYAVENGIYSLSGREVYSMVDVHVPTLTSLNSSFNSAGTYIPPEGTGYGRVKISTSSYINLSSYLSFIEGTLTDFYDIKFSYIGLCGFAGFPDLVSASFMSCKSLYAGAFLDCSKLADISFPACEFISQRAFIGCTSLPSASFPSCKTVGVEAFMNCTALSYVDFPVCKMISRGAFSNCTSLKMVSFSSCTNIDAYAFAGCRQLWEVTFPKCSTIWSSAFDQCLSLNHAHFPMGSVIHLYAFRNCQRLLTAEFGSCTNISGSAFAFCYRLISLYLLGNSIPIVNGSYQFYSTPIDGYTDYTDGSHGYIYVPSSLYDAYCSASFWSNYSSYIIPS